MLVGHESVAHVFVARGPGCSEERLQLLDLWRRCRSAFGLDEPVGTFMGDPPVDPADEDASGLVAARAASGDGLHQIVVRRTRDLYVLSLLRDPGAAEPLTWLQLDETWAAVRGPAVWTVGSVHLLQARLGSPYAVLDLDVLRPHVESALPTDTGPRGTGVVRDMLPLGCFGMWELAAGDGPWDLRQHRRIVVVAPESNERQLSAWTWSSGQSDPSPPILARYLAPAARVREVARIHVESDTLGALRDADHAVAPVRQLVDRTAGGTEPGTDELLAAVRPLHRLQAGSVQLTHRATRLRDLQRSVVIAGRNLAAQAGNDQSDDLLADDRSFAEWLERQLDHDATYVESAVIRARDAMTVADQLLQRGLQRRQERVNVALTGVVGSLLMALTAIQALGYAVTLPDSVEAALIATLGAFALLTSLVVARPVVPRSVISDVATGIGAGMLTACGTWLVAAACSVEPAAVWWWSGAVGAGTALVTSVLLIGRVT